MQTPDKTTTPANILRPVEITCDRCPKVFTLEWGNLARYVKTCPDCMSAQIKAEFRDDAAKAGQHRASIDVSGWHRHCPEDFRELDVSRLPNPAMHAEVMKWKFGPHGLALFGPTGRGKSRALYTLLKREFHAGRTLAVLDHTSGLRYADVYSEGPDAARHWFEHRCNVDLLAFDDAFKAKMTDSFEQAIFSIFSIRTERQRPCLFTLNDTGATLAARMSPDRGPAFVRRLRDYCKAVNF